DHGSIKHDGSALWNVGDLTPGESHTVHATMLVTLPGLHLNTAVAAPRVAGTASVAGTGYPYPAYAAVDEHVTRVARRRPPSRRPRSRRPPSRRPTPPVTG